MQAGIISACAEQTELASSARMRGRDHLRVCGADFGTARGGGTHRGSSPRVRSRLSALQAGLPALGIISACAEQTLAANSLISAEKDHLRVCGADCALAVVVELPLGSSPRVRSRLLHDDIPTRIGGIISACAEQTVQQATGACSAEDHLRVCGADVTEDVENHVFLGSSPRVRSRPPIETRCRLRLGIISACAEQTSLPPNGRRCGRDHLRVCGADTTDGLPLGTLTGSSPRVRSRQVGVLRFAVDGGIISACAEQTAKLHHIRPRCWDHLRVCGADYGVASKGTTSMGSSPRVRSRQQGDDR